MSQRLVSLDVLRGITIAGMILVNDPGSWQFVYAPLLHAKWHGCTPTDLVFPSFLFVVGLSMAISFSKLNLEKRSGVIPKVLKRTAIIFLIGLLLNWFPFYHKSIVDLRIFGVLQRIALAFGGAGLILGLGLGPKKILGVIVFLLLGHWAILYFGNTADPFSLENHVGRMLDVKLVGERHVYGGFGIPFDPEGLLGTISSIAQVLIAYLIGIELINKEKTSLSKIQLLGIVGLVFVVAAQLLNIVYPINKPMWTGSYVLFTCGILSLLLAVLMWLIDVKKFDKWTYVFKVFGRNPLISYIMSMIVVKIMITVIKIGDSNLYGWLYSNVYQSIFGNYLGSFLFALTVTMFVWLFAWWLYKNDKIIKV